MFVAYLPLCIPGPGKLSPSEGIQEIHHYLLWEKYSIFNFTKLYLKHITPLIKNVGNRPQGKQQAP